MNSRNRLIELSPTRFYTIIGIMQSMDKGTVEWLDERALALKEVSAAVGENEEKLARSVKSMDSEIRSTVRRKAPTTFDEYEDAGRDLRHSAAGSNFLRVSHDIVHAINEAYSTIFDLVQALKPGELVISRTSGPPKAGDFQDMQHMVYEMDMNQHHVKRFIESVNQLDMTSTWLANFLGGVEQIMGGYHRSLLHRHSVEGVLIHRDPVITDVAISLYENIDANGEVADGKDPEQVSAYTVRKAEILAGALKDEFAHGLTERPDKLNDIISSSFLTMETFLLELRKRLDEPVKKVLAAIGERPARKPPFTLAEQLDSLNELSPHTVTYRDKNVLMSPEEKFNLQFRNDTVKAIVDLISIGDLDIKELVQYVLKRKSDLRKYFQEENSFYVCRISAGNPFLGEAPGALQVIPGTRPNVKLDEIIGSGFPEVKEFAGTIEASSEWHDLFVATSPSKSADKSNVLMVGPMGCGKSEVLRAVGGDKKSIGIFAQGSDFNTCWKGEAEKNPKRLFEQAVRLQKDSRRHVHILIDEIDSVLNNDKEYGSSNLNLEFQILMDGVVQYPNLSIWGATNNIERIPMPMIRRFSKILVVGELGQEDRVKLLKMFFDYLPLGDVNDKHFEDWAKKLDGATGDVLRKIVDVVWRKKMTGFVQSNPSGARTAMAFLNGTQKFQISEFDSSQRRAFKAILGNHMKVAPADVEESVRGNLRNIGVLSEIQTAKETYANAKKFLAHLANMT